MDDDGCIDDALHMVAWHWRRIVSGNWNSGNWREFDGQRGKASVPRTVDGSAVDEQYECAEGGNERDVTDGWIAKPVGTGWWWDDEDMVWCAVAADEAEVITGRWSSTVTKPADAATADCASVLAPEDDKSDFWPVAFDLLERQDFWYLHQAKARVHELLTVS